MLDLSRQLESHLRTFQSNDLRAGRGYVAIDETNRLANGQAPPRDARGAVDFNAYRRDLTADLGHRPDTLAEDGELRRLAGEAPVETLGMIAAADIAANGIDIRDISRPAAANDGADFLHRDGRR